MTEEQRKEIASQKYRQKLKENPQFHADHLRRERARDAKRRELIKSKMAVDEDLKILATIRSRQRMRATRMRRKEEQIKKTDTRDKKPRTLERVVTQVKRHLPASPIKAVEVIKKLSAQFQVDVTEENDTAKAIPRKLTQQVKKQICDYYNRDEISRQMPGTKSVKSNTLTKLRIPKRAMIISVREAFELLKITYPKTSVGKTVFYNERPVHILPINDDSLFTYLKSSMLPAEACPETYVNTFSNDIWTGSYVLVQLLCKSDNKVTQYRYVGVCQNDIDEDGEIRVQFLKTIDGRRFVEVTDYVSYVQFEDILEKLEPPEKNINGNNILIEFSTKIDVFEKKLLSL